MCITRASQLSGSSPARFSSWMTTWACTRHSRICTVSGRPATWRSCRALAIGTRIARIFGRWRSGKPEPSALRRRLAGAAWRCTPPAGALPCRAGVDAAGRAGAEGGGPFPRRLRVAHPPLAGRRPDADPGRTQNSAPPGVSGELIPSWDKIPILSGSGIGDAFVGITRQALLDDSCQGLRNIGTPDADRHGLLFQKHADQVAATSRLIVNILACKQII